MRSWRASYSRAVAALIVLPAVLVAASVAGAQVPGSLTQLGGTDACVSEDGSGGACADGIELDFARGLAISPDGAHVYVTSTFAGNAVAALSRNAGTGKLTQLAGTDACVSESGSGGACVDGVGLDGAVTVAVSPDGSHVYVASRVSDAVAAFSRNAGTGKLTQLAGTDACVSESGSGGACVDGVGLDNASGIAISSDGSHVYVVSFDSDAVAAFSRNAGTGKLTQLAGTDACVSETGSGGACVDGVGLDAPQGVVVSPDGSHAYVASFTSDAVAAFSRNAGTGKLTQLAGTDACVSEDSSGGACVDGIGFDGAQSVVVSPDGSHAYVASRNSDAVAALSRNASTGKLTQLAGTDACVSEDGSGGACVDGIGLDTAWGVAISPDGSQVYVASNASDAVAAFSRNAGTGKLTQLAGTDACVSESGSGGACVDGVGLDGALDVVVSPDRAHLYAASNDSSAVAAFRRTVPPPADYTYYSLTVSKSGSGSGRVNSDVQLAIDCGPNCSQMIASHTFGVLTQSPDAGSVFAGWSGDCVYFDDEGCRVHMTSAKSVTATFELAEPEPSPTPEPEPEPTPTPHPEPEVFDVSVSLELVKRHGSLIARGGVSSDVPSCMQGVTVDVARLQGNDEILKGTDVTSATGRYRVALATKKGTYVAMVSAHAPEELIECLAGNSGPESKPRHRVLRWLI